MRTPLVSIVVLNYNGGKFLVEAICSILKTQYPNFEVILADNGSTDDSLYRIASMTKDPRLRILKYKQNLQYAIGNNVAVDEAKGVYVALLNNDVCTTPGWLTPLVDFLNLNPKVGACQSKLLQLFKPRIFDSAGGFITTNGVGGNRGFDVADKGQFDETEQIFVAKGAAILIRKDLFKRVGGFDPLFIALYEDVDLSWRIHLAGFKVIYVPASIVYHIGRASSRKNPSRETFLSTRNSIITLIKNYSLENLLKSLVTSILIRLFSIPMQLANSIRNSGDSDHPVLVSSPLDIFGALFSLLMNLRVILSNRMVIQMNVRKVGDDEATKQMWRIKGEIGQIVRWSLFYRKTFSYSSFLEKYRIEKPQKSSGIS